MQSVFTDIKKLTAIDPKGKYTGPCYFINEDVFLRITLQSPFRNVLILLSIFPAGLSYLLFVEGESIWQYFLGIVSLGGVCFCLFRRKELFISDGGIKSRTYIDFFGKKLKLWGAEFKLADFTKAEVFWTRPSNTTDMEAHAHLTLYSEKLYKTINILGFSLKRGGHQYFSNTLSDIEKIFNLQIEVQDREAYLDKFL